MNKMRSKALVGMTVVGLSGAVMGTPINMPDGATIGVDTYLSPYTPFSGSPAQSVDMVTYSGMLSLWGLGVETAPFANDGSLLLVGAPVRVSLQNNISGNGVFEIWRGSESLVGTTGSPLFAVSSVANTSTFKGVDVSVTKKGTTGGNLAVEGALTVAGKNVVTTAAGSGVALGGAVFTPGLNSFSIGQGKGTGTNSFSGGTSTASGTNSFSFGFGSNSDGNGSISLGRGTHAVGAYSLAAGGYAVANGVDSTALSGGVTYGTRSVALSTATANGDLSFAAGLRTVGNAYTSTTLGANNVVAAASATTWVETDPILTVGNGQTDTAQSTALETLKNGQTTLKNKAWDPLHPVDPVAGTTTASGNALVVEGNAVLKGKVTIVAQGDISMGIYAP